MHGLSLGLIYPLCYSNIPGVLRAKPLHIPAALAWLQLKLTGALANIATTRIIFMTLSHTDYWKAESMNITPGEFVMVGYGVIFVVLGYVYSLTDRAYLADEKEASNGPALGPLGATTQRKRARR